MWSQVNDFFFGMIEAIGLIVYTIYRYSIYLIIAILLLTVLAIIFAKIKEKARKRN